nr:phosphatase PAP2 family protein [Bacteroidota bacterium]
MKQLANKTLMYGGIALVLYLVFFLFLDNDISNYINDHLAGTKLQDLGTAISTMAFGAYYRLVLAIGFILIGLNARIGFLTPKWSRYLLFICVTVSIAIVFGDGIKYFLGRYRPIMSFENGLYGLHFFSSEWELNSSPSGHSIRAFALLTCLSLLFRRLTPVFIGLAVLIGLSRIIVTAHYPGDVIFGAYIGIVISFWVYKYFSFNSELKLPGQL